MLISENNVMKTLAPGLGDPSELMVYITPCLKELTGTLKQGYMSLLVIDHFCQSRWLDISQVLFMCCYGPLW